MNALEINALTKSFGDFTLDNVSFTLPRGCVLGLIGENGAGKSTTIKLILDMLRPDSGSIKVLGRDRGELPSVQPAIGLVLDEVGLPECLNTRQVADVMRLSYKNWDDRKYSELMRRFALPDNKPFKSFSRGMKMKLGIAVALSHGSKLLILDEATSGLDPVARDEVVDMFMDFTRDEEHSILISSHIVSDLEKLCDYVAFIHAGKLLVCEEKDRLLDKYALIHCSEKQLSELSEGAVRYKKLSPYGVEAVALREALPAGMSASPISLEELFVFMVKGES